MNKTKDKKVFIFGNLNNNSKTKKETIIKAEYNKPEVRNWCRRHRNFMNKIDQFNERMLKQDSKYKVNAADVGQLLIQEGYVNLPIETKHITKYWQMNYKA